MIKTRGLCLSIIVSVSHAVMAGEALGRPLLLTSVRTGDTEIFVVDPDTGDARNLSRSPKSEDRYPCWSPDGKRVAFTSNRDGPYSLYLMDADGNNVTRLIDNASVCYMPSWQKTTPGERIVFGMHGAKPEMASIAPDGSGLKMLGDGHDPTLSPDGKWISFRYTDERYWSSAEKTKKIYDEKPADKRPVWVIRPDGSDAHVIERLRFQCAMDGSRAAWKP